MYKGLLKILVSGGATMGEKNEFMKSQLVKDFTRDIQQYHLGPLWEAIPEFNETNTGTTSKSLFVDR